MYVCITQIDLLDFNMSHWFVAEKEGFSLNSCVAPKKTSTYVTHSFSSSKRPHTMIIDPALTLRNFLQQDFLAA